MQRRQFLVAGFGFAGSSTWGPSLLGAGMAGAFAAGVAGPRPSHATALQAQPPALAWHERSLVGLGTTLRLRIAHTDPATAKQALDAAVLTVRDIEASMSLFRADSEIRRLERDGRLNAPSRHFTRVLDESLHVAHRSQGAFDPTVQPLWQTYDRARRERRLPTLEERAQALARVGWRHVRRSAQAVHLDRPGMGLTFNGIAQGYAADAVREVLQAHGITHALLDTGEYAAWGRNDREGAWTLGIEDPHAPDRLLTAIRLDGRAMATSADHRSAFTADHRHHHILDPHLGDSPSELSAVTVLAPSAMRADALTKVMFIAGPQRIPALAQQWKVGVLWVDKRGRWEATPDVPVVRT